jgi:hypothetical protein
MKNEIVGFLIMSCFFLSCSNAGERKINSADSGNSQETTPALVTKKSSEFFGEWHWENSDATNSFNVTFVDNGDSIYGQYCGAYYSGNRLDCDIDTTYNLKGKIANDSISLNFYSFYGAKNGKAIIKIENGNLIWHITKWPVGGECFAPETAMLKRKLSVAAGSLEQDSAVSP